MYKKRITTCLALTALAAFILPAAVQAVNHPIVTHPTGTKLAVGTRFTATNVSSSAIANTTGSIVLTCTTVSMTGELTKNETGTVQGNITAASYGSGGGPCTGFTNFTVTPQALPWCIKATESMGNDEFQITGGKCNEAAKKVKYLWKTGSGECEYESTTTTAFKGNFTTDGTGDAILSYPRTGHSATEDTGFSKVRDTTPFQICVSSIATQMSFTLETDEAIANPLYISE